MKNKLQSGLSIIEILIGMTMSALIFLVSTSLISAILFTDTKGKNIENLEQTKNDLQSEFSSSVKWAQNIQTSEDSLTVDAQTYTLENGRIEKNGEPITNENIEIERFEVENRSTEEDIASIAITIELNHTVRETLTDTFTIVVSQRRTQINEEDE